MNKVGKTMMYMGGIMASSVMGYYVGLPKNKKEDVKNKMMNMMKSRDVNDIIK